jgi:3-oxosteroid 1-dehydrogenase
MIMAFFLNPFRCIHSIDTLRTLGNALIGRLRLSLEERGIPLWLKTPAVKLITEGERIVGLEALKLGKRISIQAKKGIVLAAGGFEKDQHMREKYQKPPVSSEWSAGNPDNTGDAIKMGMDVGADIDLMDESWWMPVNMIPGEAMPWYAKNSWWAKIAKTPGAKLAWIDIIDRCMPRSIIVNSKGRRFANEAEPYLDFTHNLLACHREKADSVPSWMIVDHKYYRTYPLGPVLPGFPIKRYIENNTVKKGNSLNELAEACGIDPEGLIDEVKIYNQYAAEGKDSDFHKGETLIDCYYADPTSKKNPCLGPIERPPFYAIRVFPGDLGTKGGLKTDAHARVLRKDGSAIEGLYATGNCAASVMGDSYPGAGGTIAPAMTFGWIAAHHASGK